MFRLSPQEAKLVKDYRGASLKARELILVYAEGANRHHEPSGESASIISIMRPLIPCLAVLALMADDLM